MSYRQWIASAKILQKDFRGAQSPGKRSLATTRRIRDFWGPNYSGLLGILRVPRLLRVGSFGTLDFSEPSSACPGHPPRRLQGFGIRGFLRRGSGTAYWDHFRTHLEGPPLQNRQPLFQRVHVQSKEDARALKGVSISVLLGPDMYPNRSIWPFGFSTEAGQGLKWHRVDS